MVFWVNDQFSLDYHDCWKVISFEINNACQAQCLRIIVFTKFLFVFADHKALPINTTWRRHIQTYTADFANDWWNCARQVCQPMRNSLEDNKLRCWPDIWPTYMQCENSHTWEDHVTTRFMLWCTLGVTWLLKTMCSAAVAIWWRLLTVGLCCRDGAWFRVKILYISSPSPPMKMCKTTVEIIIIQSQTYYKYLWTYTINVHYDISQVEEKNRPQCVSSTRFKSVVKHWSQHLKIAVSVRYTDIEPNKLCETSKHKTFI